MTEAVGMQNTRGTGADPYAAILPALKARDPVAQSAFFNQTGPRILRILIAAFHQNLSRQDCEDILIEAGLKFFQNLQRFDPSRGTRLETWFTTIAMNAARDERRRNYRHSS